MAIGFLHSSTVCEVPVSQNSVLSAEGGEQDKDCCCGLRMYPGHRTCSRDIPFLEHPSGTTLYTVVLRSNLLTHSEIDKISYQKLSLEILQLLVGGNIGSNSVVTLYSRENHLNCN